MNIEAIQTGNETSFQTAVSQAKKSNKGWIKLHHSFEWDGIDTIRVGNRESAEHEIKGNIESFHNWIQEIIQADILNNAQQHIDEYEVKGVALVAELSGLYESLKNSENTCHLCWLGIPDIHAATRIAAAKWQAA